MYPICIFWTKAALVLCTVHNAQVCLCFPLFNAIHFAKMKRSCFSVDLLHRQSNELLEFLNVHDSKLFQQNTAEMVFPTTACIIDTEEHTGHANRGSKRIVCGLCFSHMKFPLSPVVINKWVAQFQVLFRFQSRNNLDEKTESIR